MTYVVPFSVIFALAGTLAACGGEEPGDDDTPYLGTKCEDGAVQKQLCLDGSEQERTCVGGEWSAYTPCIGEKTSDEVCQDEETRAYDCPSGEEQKIVTCVSGQWITTQECPDEQPECQDDEARSEREACGYNKRGQAVYLCTGGEWVENSCNDPDECTDGTEKSADNACGRNNRGTLPSICIEGQWLERSCEDPDICDDDTTRNVGCPGGIILETCTQGQWEETEACNAECEIGDTESQACGLNDNGSQELICDENGTWQEQSPCVDPDVCTNGDTQVGKCGYNNNGVYDRVCKNGQWDDNGATTACADPDECVKDAIEEGLVCDGEFGQRSRSCKEFKITGRGSIYVWNYHACESLGLDVSNTHGCAINYNQQLYCWGQNTSGSLGNGTKTATKNVTRVRLDNATPLTHVTNVAVGEDFSCAIAKPGNKNELFCWGKAIANGSTTQQSFAKSVAGPWNDRDLVDLNAGRAHACVVDQRGKTYCWGNNDYGQLGNGKFGRSSAVPVQVLLPTGKSAMNVTLDFDQSCATLTGLILPISTQIDVACWGRNTHNNAGGLGKGPDMITTPTVIEKTVSGETPLGMTSRNLCIIHHMTVIPIGSTNTVFCVGPPTTAHPDQNGTIAYRNEWKRMLFFDKGNPLQLKGGGIDNDVNMCAMLHHDVDTSQRLWCWGGNKDGSLGRGPTGSSPTFTTAGLATPATMRVNAKTTLSNVIDFSVASNAICALTSAGRVYCTGLWSGANGYAREVTP